VYYILQGKGEIRTEDGVHPFESGDAVLNRENVYHAVYNTGAERIRLLVVGGIMFVPLWPKWPTETPYEIDAADTKS
jgi:uncharacterized cupin superfamily protein